MVSLSHCCSQAVKMGWMRGNPCSKVEKLEEPKGRTRFLSDDERDALLKACKEHDDKNIYLVVVLALSTGMRSGEIRNLKWSDVSMKHKRIVLTNTKNNETRTVPLVGHALDLMRQKVRRIDSPYVFTGRFKDRPASFRGAWEEVVATAELDDFRFYDTALTPNQVTDLYERTAPQVHLRFDEDELAGQIFDASPNRADSAATSRSVLDCSR